MKFSAEVILPVEPDAAWRRLLAWEDQPRWMADADRVRVLTARGEGVGVVIAVSTRVLGVPLFTERLEVVGWEPPRRLVLAHRSFVRGTGEWRLEPAPGGARFRWTETLSLPIPFLGELLLLAYRPVMRRLMRRSQANLAGMLRA